MTAATPISGTDGQPDGRGRWVARGLTLLGLGGLLGAGALMWTRHGESIFADLMSAAIAWCM